LENGYSVLGIKSPPLKLLHPYPSVKELPANVTAYKRTPTFTELSVPEGLLSSHRTKPGTWGKIIVLKGRLTYRILEPDLQEFQLDPDHPGIIEPTVKHEVQPQGEVEFYVEFYRE
jgi:tellurite resistance-related uncharacterized protein